MSNGYVDSCFWAKEKDSFSVILWRLSRRCQIQIRWKVSSLFTNRVRDWVALALVSRVLRYNNRKLWRPTDVKNNHVQIVSSPILFRYRYEIKFIATGQSYVICRSELILDTWELGYGYTWLYWCEIRRSWNLHSENKINNLRGRTLMDVYWISIHTES